MSPVPRKKRRSKANLPPPIVSLVRLVHPFPSLLVSAVTVAIAVFAIDDPETATVVVLGTGMLCFQFAIGIANDVVDAQEDAKTKPWKAIPRGVVPRQAAVIATVALAGTGLIITSGLPIVAWFIGMAGLACGLVYDVQLKRTALSWVPLAVALPLVPVWAFTAFEAWDHLLWWAFPLGALLGLALHVANQLPDLEAEEGAKGTAHRLGARRAFRGAVGVFGVAGGLACVVLLLAGEPGRAGLCAVSVVFAGSLSGRAVVLFGRDGLFGLFAASAAALAMVFLSAVG